MRHGEEPALTDQDRRAIEKIRRQLDRELGPPWPEPDGSAALASSNHEPSAAMGRAQPKRGGRGLRLALSAGAVTLAAAVIGAVMSIADLSSQSARSPVSAPGAAAVISRIPPEAAPAPAAEVHVRESPGPAELADPPRVVPGAERAAIRNSSARGPDGEHRGGRVVARRPGTGGAEAQPGRWSRASATRYATAAPVGLRPARSAALATIQAP